MKRMTKLHYILIVVLVAVLAASIFFTLSYRKAEAQQPDLENDIQLALLQLETAKQENDPTDLIAQLEERQKTLNSLTRDEPLFPKTPPMVEINGLVYNSADKLKLIISKFKSNDQAGTVTVKSAEDAESNKYSKAEFEIEVKGDLGRIVSFIGEIEGAEFTTLVIEDLDLNYYEEYDEETEKTDIYWTAEFTIVTLYEYQEKK